MAGRLRHVVPVAPGTVRRLVSALRGVHQGDVSSYGSPRVVQGHRLAAVLQDPGRRLVDHGLPEAGSAISGYGTRHRHLVTHSHTTISALLQEHGLSPSRALGQNFVTDPNTVRRIARLADVGPNDFVLEIGPGLGSLTLALVETGATVEAIEVDRYLLPALRSVVDAHGVTVHHADALTANYDEILHGRPTTVVANLPYNVATPLVLHLLETVPCIERMLVMVQREVGERMAAHVGDDAYGAVSLRVDYFAEATVVGRVPPTVFHPKPNVDSALVALRRRPAVKIAPSVVAEDVLFDVIRTGFAHRRKMLRRTLSAWATAEHFAAAGVDPTARPEELALEDFARLAAVR